MKPHKYHMDELSFKNWLLQEMPINLNLVGKWDDARKKVISGEAEKTHAVRYQQTKNLAFNPTADMKDVPGLNRWPSTSIKLLTSPKGRNKIVKKFKNVPEDFSVNLVIDPRVEPHKRLDQSYVQITDKGIVGEDFIRNTLLISKEEAPIYPDKINIFFMRNDGNDSMDMNAWTIAHRFGHITDYWEAGSQSNRKIGPYHEFKNSLETAFKRLLDECYGVEYRPFDEIPSLYNALGTMKSARDNRIGSMGDFISELLSQYIFQRKIKLGPMPQKLLSKKGEVIATAKKLYDLNGSFYQKEWEEACQKILDQSKGKIFVM